MRYLPAGPRIAAALLLVAVVVVAPGQFGTPFDGPPLSEAARWALVGLLWLSVCAALFPPQRSPPLAWLAVLLCAAGAQVALGQGSAPRGWAGTYEMRDAPPEVARFAWRYRSHHVRIDSDIDFGGLSFGLHFLNDLQRYGSAYHRVHPRDTEIPLRVTWRGVARLRAPSRVAVTAGAAGSVTVALNGRSLMASAGPVTQAVVTSEDVLPAGELSIEVVYDKPADVRPAIHVQLLSPTFGTLAVGPFGPPLDDAPESDRVQTSTVIVAGAFGLLLGIFLVAYGGQRAGLVLGVTPGTFLARAAILLAFGAVLLIDGLSVIPGLHETMYLWAGDDPLAYVSNARNILLDGWLMPGGKPPGQGEPFYFYPLFGYVIGLAHWFIGEDFAVVQLVNGWSVALILPFAYALGWHTRRWWVTVCGSVALYWVIDTHMMPYAKAGYTDSVFAGLVFVALVLCRRALHGPRPWALAAGIACAMAAAARPSFLTFTPLLVVAILAFGRAAGIRGRFGLAAILVAGFVLGLMPFALRNYIVSGKFVVLVNSWIQLPYFLVPPEISPNPVPTMFQGVPTLTESLVAVARMVAADPLGIAWLEMRKMLFTAGFMQFGAAGVQAHPEFLVFTGLFLVAVVTRRLPRDILLVTGVFTVSHVAAMVLAAPWTYGYKSILPLQAMFLFGAAFLLPATTSAPPHGQSSELPHVARS